MISYTLCESDPFSRDFFNIPKHVSLTFPKPSVQSIHPTSNITSKSLFLQIHRIARLKTIKIEMNNPDRDGKLRLGIWKLSY